MASPSPRLAALLADRRSQPLCCRIEPSCCHRCTPSRSQCSSRRELCRDFLIRFCRAEREGEPALRDPIRLARDAYAVAAAVRPRRSQDHRRKQWCWKRNPILLRGQHPGLLRLEERRTEVAKRGAPRQERIVSAATSRPRRARAAVRAATGSGPASPLAPRDCWERQGPIWFEIAVRRAREPSRAHRTDFPRTRRPGARVEAAKRRAESELHQVMERSKRERPGGDAQQSVCR